MIVTRLQKLDLVTCQAGEVAEQSFHCHRPDTPCSLQDHCTVRTVACRVSKLCPTFSWPRYLPITVSEMASLSLSS